MTRSATQVLAHLPGLFQQLLSVAHHLRVTAQHNVAALGVHRQADGLFQRAGFNQERMRPVSMPGAVSRLTTDWMRSLPA